MCLGLMSQLLFANFLAVNGDLDRLGMTNLCAQIRAESNFDPDAESRVGARGLGQFMRPTWGDVGPRVGCPNFDQAFEPQCNLRAQRHYMALLRRSRICVGTDPAEPWTLAFACYNAGLGHVRKERRLCAGPLHPNCDPTRWFEHVENTCLRRPSACHETRVYNERIRYFGALER